MWGIVGFSRCNLLAAECRSGNVKYYARDGKDDNDEEGKEA